MSDAIGADRAEAGAGAAPDASVDRRCTAFVQLDDARLAGAVALGERLLVERDPLLRELDACSLAWRGKPPKRRCRWTAGRGAAGAVRASDRVHRPPEPVSPAAPRG